jgi:hypothetical protein
MAPALPHKSHTYTRFRHQHHERQMSVSPIETVSTGIASVDECLKLIVVIILIYQFHLYI